MIRLLLFSETRSTARNKQGSRKSQRSEIFGKRRSRRSGQRRNAALAKAGTAVFGKARMTRSAGKQPSRRRGLRFYIRKVRMARKAGKRPPLMRGLRFFVGRCRWRAKRQNSPRGGGGCWFCRRRIFAASVYRYSGGGAAETADLPQITTLPLPARCRIHAASLRRGCRFRGGLSSAAGSCSCTRARPCPRGSACR